MLKGGTQSQRYILLTLILLVLAFMAVMAPQRSGPTGLQTFDPQETIPVGQEITDSQGNTLGTKIADEPAYDTHFTSVNKGNSLFVATFYHDHEEALPVWVTGDGALSSTLAEPYENVTLTVPLEEGVLPYFELHIGEESEVFAFGTQSDNTTDNTTTDNQSTTEENTTDTTQEDTSFGTTGFSTQSITSCGDVSSSDNLTQDISSSNGCINITADNVVLDCNGFTISYNTDGGDDEFGVNITDRNNITVRNCIIRDVNNTGAGNDAILVVNTTVVSFINNTLQTNGTSDNRGIDIDTDSHNATITNNTITTEGNESSNQGIRVFSDNNTITGNTITTNGTGDNRGIFTLGDNTVITSNTITTNGSSSGNRGIVLDALNNRASHNTITTNGTSSNDGITILGGAVDTNNRVNNNTITTDGSSAFNDGMGVSAQNNTITNNTITVFADDSDGILSERSTNFYDNNTIATFGSTSYAVFIQASGTAVFTNTTLDNPTRWMQSLSANIGNFTNTTFKMPNGSIRIPGLFTINGTDILKSKLNITFNRAFLNSSNLSALNQSGQITLTGVTSSTPTVDFEDDGTFELCSGAICTVISTGANLVYNVTQFTTYSSATECGNITTNTTLLTNVSSNDTCFTITQDDLTLDCDGNTIEFNLNGGSNEEGIDATSRNNITIQNCVIQDLNNSGSSISGIQFFTVTNSTVKNTTIQVNGTSSSMGINLVFTSSGNHLFNNTIEAKGGGIANDGIVLTSSPDNVVYNNTIDVNGTAAARGITVSSANNNTMENNTITVTNVLDGIATISGIGLQSSTANATISGNNISVNGTGSRNRGIVLNSSATENTVIHNTIATDGDDVQNQGIFFSTDSGQFNNLTNNTITTNGTNSNAGIGINNPAHNTTVDSNTITTDGSSTSNIGISLFSQDNTITQNTITTLSASSVGMQIEQNGSVLDSNTIATRNTTSFGISISNDARVVITNTTFDDPTDWVDTNSVVNGEGNFTNTTFQTPNGSIFIPGLFTIANGTDILKQDLNISFNEAFLNSSALSALNQSGRVNLSGVTSSTPAVDFEDDGTFELCSGAICTVISTGSELVYNVTQFTTYSSATECGNVTTNTTLITNVSSNGTCFTVTVDDVTLNCDGFSIIGNGSGNAITDGLGRENITIANCLIRNFTQAVELSDLDTGFIINNTVDNVSIGLNFVNALNILIGNNSLLANSSTNASVRATGVGLGNHTISNNNVTNIGGNAAFRVGGLNNIVNNNMGNGSDTTATSTIGFVIDSSSNNSVIRNNTGIGIRFGISVGGPTSNLTLVNNTGISDTFAGIFLGSVENSVIANNTGTSNTAQGIHLSGSSGTGNNTVTGNIGNSTSAEGISIQNVFGGQYRNNHFASVTGTALELTGDSENHTFFNNTLEANGTWLTTSAPDNNLTNTTFLSPAGSIKIINTTTIPTSENVSTSNLNTSFNRAFLNSSQHSFLNQSGQVTLLGVTNTTPIVDFDNDGIFEFCPTSICTVISTGANLVYNTTRFTTYSSAIGGVNVTLEKTDSPDPLNLTNTTLLNYTITINVTDGVAFNVTLTDTLPDQVTFINSSPAADTGNTTFDLGNLTATNTPVTVNITVNVSTSIANGTVINNTANITFQNSSSDNLSAQVTENTTILSTPPGNITINKTDDTDPISPGDQLTYTITLNVTGVTTNVTVVDTLPADVTFDSASPSPTSGNTTFALGDLTDETQTINITVNVSSTASGTLTNNVNVTFQNSTGATLSAATTETTTVQAPAAPGQGGGGGAGAGATICPPLCQDPQYASLPQCRNCPTTQEPTCVESWQCTSWSACSNGEQTRNCVDVNACGTTEHKPATEQACTETIQRTTPVETEQPIVKSTPQSENAVIITPPTGKEKFSGIVSATKELASTALEKLGAMLKAATGKAASLTAHWSSGITGKATQIANNANNLCTGLSLSADVLLGLAILTLIITLLRKHGGLVILSALLAISLGILIAHYVSCQKLLPIEYSILAGIVLLTGIYAIATHAKQRAKPTAKPEIKPPSTPPKPAKPKKPFFTFKPKKPEKPKPAKPRKPAKPKKPKKAKKPFKLPTFSLPSFKSDEDYEKILDKIEKEAKKAKKR